MKIIPYILLLLLPVFGWSGSGKRDSVFVTKKTFFHLKKENILQSPMIERMSNEQLVNLIEHMFEAPTMPPDLWSLVIMETAKRNLNKSIDWSLDDNSYFENKSPKLYIERPILDPFIPSTRSNLKYFRPDPSYYTEWSEDISTLFSEQFVADSSYIVELENSKNGYFQMPAWGPLSSPFGWRHNRYHKGVDIQLRKGDTVNCAFNGIVRFAQKKGGFGNVVIVRHFNGLETVYGHLSKIEVREGQTVNAGELIGLAGSTGHSTGPHLHFETRFLGLPVNPKYFISFEYGNILFNTVVLSKNSSGLLAAFEPNTEFHKVDKGETLLEIASHYGTSPQKIRVMNNIPAKKYIHLKQDMILRVREAQYEQSASK